MRLEKVHVHDIQRLNLVLHDQDSVIFLSNFQGVDNSLNSKVFSKHLYVENDEGCTLVDPSLKEPYNARTEPSGQLHDSRLKKEFTKIDFKICMFSMY